MMGTARRRRRPATIRSSLTKTPTKTRWGGGSPLLCLILAVLAVAAVAPWLAFAYFGLDANGASGLAGASLKGQEAGAPKEETKQRLRTKPIADPEHPRVLYFQDGGRGQGVGNVMKGLLTAIDLANAFDRTVCVDWRAYNVAFEEVEANKDICNRTRYVPAYIGAQRNKDRTKVEYWDFKPTDTFEKVRKIVASSVQVVDYMGNTGVGGPFYTPEVRRELYRDFFVPTEALLRTVPWADPPECVVHLRLGDGYWDVREGVNDASLDALARELDKDCYLITNHHEWYERFEKAAGWGHPPWKSVWRHQSSSSDKMELWSDWYTVLHAQRVYHTPSGFSESAVHISGARSWTIRNATADGRLRLEDDSPIAVGR